MSLCVLFAHLVADSLVEPELSQLTSRAFKHSFVFVWNSLPTDIRNCDSLLAFRRRLKSFLFNSAFTP